MFEAGHVFVQTQIGNQLLQPRVLIAQLLCFLAFAGLHLAVLRFPRIDGVDTHSHFLRDVGCTRACIHLLSGGDDGRFTMFTLRHSLFPFPSFEIIFDFVRF